MRTRAQPAPSGERQRPTNDPAAARFSKASADRLWLARSTRDQLSVAWPAVNDVVSWQVVCWDSRDAAVGRLRLTGEHRRATFARLAGLPQPFTIAVSGLGGDGSVLWQRGLADLYLRAERAPGEDRISDSRRGADAARASQAGKGGLRGSKAAEEGRRGRQGRRVEQAEAEEDLARKVAAAQAAAVRDGSLRPAAGSSGSGRSLGPGQLRFAPAERRIDTVDAAGPSISSAGHPARPPPDDGPLRCARARASPARIRCACSPRSHVIERIRGERAAGKSFAEIADGLNAHRIPTAQGGRRWYPSTIRSTLERVS